jgi:hypothetical protein
MEVHKDFASNDLSVSEKEIHCKCIAPYFCVFLKGSILSKQREFLYGAQEPLLV